MKKHLLAWLTLLMLLVPAAGLCEESGAAVWEALPMGCPAPYGAVEGALSEDGLHYDDGSLKVDVETEKVERVTVYYVYVTIQDASQLRTATAGNPRSKTRAPVYAMAEKNNAVLAFNGDYYNYRDTGVVYRNGERIRFNVSADMDMLIVDENADLHVIDTPTTKKIEAFEAEHTIREALAFGPALIKNGEKLIFKHIAKISCGYPEPDERLVICQLADDEAGANRYLFIACDNPGLSVRTMTDLALEKGAVTAYNLDGGTSTSVYLCGVRINRVPKDREVGDIIYFATLVPGGESESEEGE